jgi:hypothetical protein
MLEQLLLDNAQDHMRHKTIIFNPLTNIISRALSWTLLM